MLAYLFFVLAIAARFNLAHLMNFSPLGAALLFFGARRPRKEWLPIVAAAMAADAVLTTQFYHLPLRWDYVASLPYYVAALFLGSLLSEGLHDKISALKVAGASIAGSLAFFLTSNFVAWLGLDMYTKDLRGLAQAYVLAIPFFRGTFAGDLVYAFAMFGAPLLIASLQRKRSLAYLPHS